MTARSTGILGFDRVLGGGLFPGDVLELYGEHASGKTQMCVYLASKVSRWDNGNSTVVYFDLKNDFSAQRLLELSGDDETGLDNVMVYAVDTFDKLTSTLDKIRNEFARGCDGFFRKCKLLVIDSAPMAIYPAVRDKYSWRHLSDQLLQRLEIMALQMQLTVVLVNQAVKPWTRYGSFSVAPTVKAALGEYWRQKVKIRICLSKLLCNTSDCYSGSIERWSRAPLEEIFYFYITTNKIMGFEM